MPPATRHRACIEETPRLFVGVGRWLSWSGSWTKRVAPDRRCRWRSPWWTPAVREDSTASTPLRRRWRRPGTRGRRAVPSWCLRHRRRRRPRRHRRPFSLRRRRRPLRRRRRPCRRRPTAAAAAAVVEGGEGECGAVTVWHHRLRPSWAITFPNCGAPPRKWPASAASPSVRSTYIHSMVILRVYSRSTISIKLISTSQSNPFKFSKIECSTVNSNKTHKNQVKPGWLGSCWGYGFIGKGFIG